MKMLLSVNLTKQVENELRKHKGHGARVMPLSNDLIMVYCQLCNKKHFIELDYHVLNEPACEIQVI